MATAKKTKKPTAKKAVKKTTARRAPAKTTAKRKVATAKKATKAVRKASAKITKKVVKKVAAKKPVARKSTAIATAYTKSQTITAVADATELSRKQVTAVMDELAHIMSCHLKKRACGTFAVPGLGMKCVVVRKPATKARKGINPFTGEETVFKAKPARNVVKVRPLKSLKDMAS